MIQKNTKVLTCKLNVFFYAYPNVFRILLLYLHNVLDPMGAIIPRMPRKRQKVSYIDRLLELGVITDKKQCRKKKQRKNAKSTDADDDKSNGKLLNNFTLL